MGGDKGEVQTTSMPFEECLAAGISISSIEYRLTDVAPFPAQMHDSARALQLIRNNAAEWNIDPARIAACGPSAGAGISQWLAFHKDLADPENDDPVKQQSTHVSCAILLQGQSTYDPRIIRDIIPGKAYDHVAMKRLFGVPDDHDWDKDDITPEVEDRIRECGPITHLTPDAPPVLAKYCKEHDVVGQIHHPNFGKHLEQEMTKVGVTCLRRIDTEYKDGMDGFYLEFLSFLKEHLKV